MPIRVLRRVFEVALSALLSACEVAPDRPRGAATAPAITPPVVARKFLRVEESGSEELPMKVLDVECKNRTLYARRNACGAADPGLSDFDPRNPRRSVAKKFGTKN